MLREGKPDLSKMHQESPQLMVRLPLVSQSFLRRCRNSFEVESRSYSVEKDSKIKSLLPYKACTNRETRIATGSQYSNEINNCSGLFDLLPATLLESYSWARPSRSALDRVDHKFNGRWLIIENPCSWCNSSWSGESNFDG